MTLSSLSRFHYHRNSLNKLLRKLVFFAICLCTHSHMLLLLCDACHNGPNKMWNYLRINLHQRQLLLFATTITSKPPQICGHISWLWAQELYMYIYVCVCAGLDRSMDHWKICVRFFVVCQRRRSSKPNYELCCNTLQHYGGEFSA